MWGMWLLLTCLLLLLPTAMAEPLRGQVASGEGRIGVLINTQGTVSRVYYASPAQQSGIEPGDRVTEVNYLPFSLRRLTGSPGEWVHLKVRRGAIVQELDMQYIPYQQVDRHTPPQRYRDEHEIIYRLRYPA